ncbi:MAG: NDP-sugar synthase [Candidatus Nanopelagicales bacterium]|nr:NDP-sugar synthase [Candidatus Nanopelagicales bacterium]
MLESILLVGGKGTRLRPLTINTPKPMLPVAGVPFTEHQIAIARAAGVTRVVLGTSYRAEVFSDYFGDGSAFGVALDYRVEDEPLGTGGAIRNAAAALTCGPDDPVVVFNGDILTGLDIPAMVRAWVEADADVALYLTRVDDPRAFGLVPTVGDRVTAFLEKPQTPEEIVTDQINAGCYIFRRSVIDEIPTGRPVSVERETFPGLLEAGRTVLGWVDPGYWLDLGTPLAFAQGSADIVTGVVGSPALPGAPGPALVGDGAQVRGECTAGTSVGAGAVVGERSQVRSSVLFDRARIGSDVVVENSIIGAGSSIGDGCVLRGVVVGDGARIGAGNELLDGVRVWPDMVLDDCSVRFSSDQ